MSRLTQIARLLTPAALGVALSVAAAQAQVTGPVVNTDSQSTTNTTQGNAQNMVFNSAQPLARQEVVTTPDAIAPSIGGGNPCVISASMGVSGMGFGVSGGLGIQDPECETRQQVALLVNMGAIDVAVARFCMEAEVREAFRLAGKPCPGDVAAAQQAAAPAPAPVQPAVVETLEQISKTVVKTSYAAPAPAAAKREVKDAAPIRQRRDTGSRAAQEPSEPFTPSAKAPKKELTALRQTQRDRFVKRYETARQDR